MIDVHIHVLPGVDDGAASLDVAREMLIRAKELGFTTLVATPHLDGPLTPAYRASIEEAAAAIDPEAKELGLSLVRGFENLLTPDLPRRLECGEPVTLGGSRTILVELPFSGWPLHTEQALFAIQAAGFRPLLAHPERYATLHADLDRALALAERGVLLQVTIGSLAGLFGRHALRVAEELLLNDAVTVLATDAHFVGQRIDTVPRGLERARQLVGEARVRQLLNENPEALLRDQALPALAPREPESGEESRLRAALRRLNWRATAS
ncbi:MAG: tyrosine protein phosphatase [Thermomicrobiales bacterium]|nr:MAG: tyrosine protein phosphatase [Thermomicrobiales bacterium]